MTTHLRPTQLAAYLDLAPQKISQLRARGIITPEADGSYEAEATRIAYIRHLRANVVPAASATLTEERARLLRARRERMELETPHGAPDGAGRHPHVRGIGSPARDDNGPPGGHPGRLCKLDRRGGAAS